MKNEHPHSKIKYPPKKRKGKEVPQRLLISIEIKKLILGMKQTNPLRGCHRIADELKKIVIELNPSREFVKQWIQLYTEDFPKQKTLIFDNAPQFTTIDYYDYGIDGVNTAPVAQNMNAFIERTIGSMRREILDHFLLISEKRIRKIVREYIDYYNHYRPRGVV